MASAERKNRCGVALIDGLEIGGQSLRMAVDGFLDDPGGSLIGTEFFGLVHEVIIPGEMADPLDYEPPKTPEPYPFWTKAIIVLAFCVGIAILILESHYMLHSLRRHSQ
jgi:hypothetical protein